MPKLPIAERNVILTDGSEYPLSFAVVYDRMNESKCILNVNEARGMEQIAFGRQKRLKVLSLGDARRTLERQLKLRLFYSRICCNRENRQTDQSRIRKRVHN